MKKQLLTLLLLALASISAFGQTPKTNSDVLFGTNSGGTVTSVAVTMPSIITVAGSPITTSGTIAGTLATQSANTVWAGPATGSAATPTFRALVDADLSGTTATLGGNTFSGSGSTIIRQNTPTITTPTLNTPTIAVFSSAQHDHTNANGGGQITDAALSAVVGFAKGGTGQSAYTDGQLMIGNTATGGISKATLTAGTNVTITNGNGTITIAASGGGGGTTINTSGQGIWIPDVLYDADNFEGTNADQVKFYRFINPVAVTADRSDIRALVASAGGKFSYQLRSWDCTTTTYFSSGVLDTTSWGGADITTTISSNTLPAGGICLLWTADNSTAKVRVVGPQANTMGVWNIPASGTKRLGTCSNTSSVGVLPSACGTETGSNTQGILQLTLRKN